MYLKFRLKSLKNFVWVRRREESSKADLSLDPSQRLLSIFFNVHFYLYISSVHFKPDKRGDFPNGQLANWPIRASVTSVMLYFFFRTSSAPHKFYNGPSLMLGNWNFMKGISLNFISAKEIEWERLKKTLKNIHELA